MKQNDPGKRIESVWLFVAVDEDGDEGLPAFGERGGMLMPMVASDEKRRDLLLEHARQIVTSVPGHRIEVRRFTGDYIVEEIIE